MKTKNIILVIIVFITISCKSTLINTLLKINIGEAKKIAKVVIENEEVDLSEFPISAELAQYVSSEKGQKYYSEIRTRYGDIKKMEINNIIGDTEDIMNYRFITSFENIEDKQEVRVQSYQDREIVSIEVGPWNLKMEPLNK